MNHLSNTQKEILIFLLVALVVILFISFASYVIWKKFCEKKVRERRQNRRDAEDDFAVNCDDDVIPMGERPFHIGQGETLEMTTRNPQLSLYPALRSGEYQSLSTAHTSASALSPSAPSLASFYANSNASTEASTLSAESRERLPTYQEAVNQNG